MIFIIPVILGAVALATAATGTAAGIDGISKIKKAEKKAKDAQKRHKKACKLTEEELRRTQTFAEEYGQFQLEIKRETIGRFITFIERIGQRASQSDMEFLEGLEGVSPQQIEEYKTAVLEAEHFAKGGLAAAGAAYAAGQGTIGLVGLFGAASTGTAISGLSGAAAWNATLAWLGGGSLAAGGGGMALGTVVLGGIAVGPAVMVGGFVIGSQGEKALTKARKYEKKVNCEIEKLSAFRDFLSQVQRRIIELKNLIKELNQQAIESLDELESKPFDPRQDAALFQQTALLIKAIAEILKTPVLDADGNLNPASELLKAKYKPVSETDHEG